MRYYRIELTDASGKPVTDANGMKIFPLYSVPEKGERQISAPLQVAFDINTITMDLPAQGAMLVIYGLPLSMLRQAVNLQNSIVTIYAGFSKGLPLANSAQQGMILTGRVWSSYGNWEGVNQTLNLIINPMEYTTIDGEPININMSGKKGEKLADVITRTLTEAYPNKKITVDIHQNLILQEDWIAPFRTLTQMSLALKNITIGMNGGLRYSGVRIVVQKGEINIFDNSVTAEPIKFYAQDIIGQPTWVGGNDHFATISVKTPMRADLSVGDHVTLPIDIINGPLSILSIGSQMSIINETQRLSFTGIYVILGIRHIGDFYNGSGESWVTVFEMVEISEWEKQNKRS
ncbi:MAG: hypothetical protein ACRDCA_12380 [Serratia sp. (in: enterobacteria)]|uniref:hypothetical protein n=1 Tax=Serratia sp. (in: enterobacteria) TaxID=616 RepID=UPI003F3061B5